MSHRPHARTTLRGLAAGLGLALTALAPAAHGQDIELDALGARWRTTFERLDPDGPDDLFVVGLHYDLLDRLRVLPGTYLGIGGYGAVGGQRGGLLVAGLTLGLREPLNERWILDLGTFVGGGGGDFESGVDSTDRYGGGLYLRPHVALEYGTGLMRWRLEASHVEMPGGGISSTQVAIGVEGFDEILTANYTFEDLAAMDSDALVESYLPVTLGTRLLEPVGGAQRRDGKSLDETILLASLALERGLGDGWYVPFELAGAYAGSVSGYAQFLVGLGYRGWLVERSIGMRTELAAGAAGGGQVDTGGGFLTGARSGFEFQLGPDWIAHLTGGFQIAPDGDFQAATVSLGASYSPIPLELRNGYPRALLGEEGVYSFDVRLDPWTVELIHKSYSLDSEAQLTDGTSLDDDVHLMGLGLSKEIVRDVDISARAFTAYEGEVPGYHEGQLGLRYSIPVLEPIDAGKFYLQYHAGAAGGGGLANGSGFTHNLVGGWHWRPYRGLRFGFEAGRLESERGDLDGDLYAFTMSFGATRPLAPRGE
ncbi:MAG: hypothetical protein AAFZ65_18125 [Planctomycetota bacterium]